MDGDGPDPHGSAAISRAARVLQLLHDHPQGLSQTEIGERLELARSTIGRTIAALRDEGFIAPMAARGPYRLGPAITAMAHSIRRSAAIELHAALEQLARAAGETVQLFASEPGGVTLLDQVVAPRRLRVVGQVGESAALHCTAPGKVVLAAATPAQRARLLPRTLPARTASTITDRNALFAQLATVRGSGVAFDHQEDCDDVCAAAVAAGPPGAGQLVVAVAAPASRFAGREDEFGTLLCGWAAAVRDDGRPQRAATPPTWSTWSAGTTAE
ncbi:IclR family transcriptional regulator C-terminal domain-containing protein [Pseudonocardia sp.]|uniref:IclR family transcriptional regulator n=1 Tax=Pseudonocardia sp. TaxID=60912 RepID=UPI002631C7C0|nr:IclR family transcriptional regulator C-terminal domain-containing protein [Pseudonocardia sp.]